jgi:hypothetical protein
MLRDRTDRITGNRGIGIEHYLVIGHFWSRIMAVVVDARSDNLGDIPGRRPLGRRGP